ncbi:MAG: cation transporter [Planctomycetota bacterium]
MSRRRNTGRTGLFVVVTLGLGALLAAALVHKGPSGPTRSIATVTTAGATFPLVGLDSEACVTTVRAALSALPGVERLTVTRDSASIAIAASASLDEKAVIAAVRASGHEVAGSEDVSPRLAPLSADEVRKLDELKGTWLDVRCTPPACLTCSLAFEGRVRELAGVSEVVAIHFRDHLAVKRDAGVCTTSKLAAHLRALTHAPVTIAPTKLVQASIAGMTCQKCIGSIRGVLLRTDGVLSPTVEMNWAKVIVESKVPGAKVKDAIESAPGPACKSIPEHTFRANVTDEKDDGAPSR